MARLWDIFDGEPFLDNPSVYIVNRGTRMRMRRDAFGRFIGSNPRRRRRKRSAAAGKRKAVRRRRVLRRAGARTVIRMRRPRSVVLTNPRRRRRYRRNPALFGLSMPNLRTVGFTVAGVAGTPFVEGFVQKLAGSSLGLQGKLVNYAVKIASAYGLSYGIGMVAGREARNAALIGGLAYVGVSALGDLGLLPAAGAAPATTGRYFSAQPLLGAYTPKIGSYITARTPGRLQPESRF